jgi:hypothetical protein
MPDLNPGQLKKWGELIERYLGLDPELLYFRRNPPSIEGEADVDIRVWYPLDESHAPGYETEPEAYFVAAEWVSTWDVWW